MKFSEFKRIAPASVPVASVSFRGEKLDIFPLRGEDIFWLLREAPKVVEAWASDEEDVEPKEGEEPKEGNVNVSKILQAIGDVGPEAVNRIISVSVRADVSDVKEMDLSFDEELSIFLAALEHGLPEDLLGKLFGGLRKAAARAGLQIPTQLT